jgi:2-oxoglutarate ferredoxin oxidoreductase subunit gamma
VILHRILIAGAGGQGLVFLGKVLANAALETFPHITFFPSYGAEVRGGTSNCQVILSDTEIPSPLVNRFDVLILMNQDSADKFLPALAPRGLALINTSMARVEPGPNRRLVAATEQAETLGDGRVANLILLGMLLKARPLVPAAAIEQALRAMVGARPAVLDSNLAAFRAGLAMA